MPGEFRRIVTGHDTYEDCVRCMRAGAYTYLPKTDKDGEDCLYDVCREILFPRDEDDPFGHWVHMHRGELATRYPGKTVGLVTEAAAKQSGVDPKVVAMAIDGYVALAFDSPDEFAESMLADPVLRWQPQHMVRFAPNPRHDVSH